MMNALIFKIENERFGIALDDVAEMFVFTSMRRFSGQSTFIMGEMNLHGEPLPIIDFSKWLGFQRNSDKISFSSHRHHLASFPNNTRLLVIHCSGYRLGLIVDDIMGEKNIGMNLKHSDPVINESIPDYVECIVPDDEGPINLLKVNQVLCRKALNPFIK